MIRRAADCKLLAIVIAKKMEPFKDSKSVFRLNDTDISEKSHYSYFPFMSENDHSSQTKNSII